MTLRARLAFLFASLTLAAAFGFAGGPPPAGAHAILEESSPDRGAVLDRAPAEVNFHFNEPVEADFGAVQVFDSAGKEMETGEKDPSADGKEIGVVLPNSIGDGFYTAVFHVVSADSHPVSGGITFSVDTGAKDSAATGDGKSISELLAASEAGQIIKVGFWLDRWIGFLAIALAIGSFVWMMLVWRRRFRTEAAGFGPGSDGSEELGRRLRRLLLAAITAGVASSLLAIPFQGAVASGGDLWSAFGGGIPGEVISTRFGTSMLVRTAAFLLLLPLAATVIRVARERRPGPAAIAAILFALVSSVALVMAPGLAGHAATQDPSWLLIPSDGVHVAGMVAWSGGLAAMLWLLPAATAAVDTTSRTPVLLAGMRGFSTVALAAVIAIAVSGTVQAVAVVGSVDALVETAFGRAVVIKILLFAVLIVFGTLNRNRVIPALASRVAGRETPGTGGMRARSNLRIETVLVVAVLAVTAALVSYPPPKAVTAGPVTGAFLTGNERIEYVVDPGRLGANEAHVYIFDDQTGAPTEVKSLKLTFDPPSEGRTPIEADVRKAGPGHYVAPSVALAIKGEWTAEATIRFSRFEERVEPFEVKIR